ncbi:YjbF family lipoprotein [Luteimonas sp. C3_2_a3]|uniref:YjbF family lipoprotein n=1 Tax=Luteimonas salinilitoris TaxID=3237697 RepID=UPI00351C06AE
MGFVASHAAVRHSRGGRQRLLPPVRKKAWQVILSGGLLLATALLVAGCGSTSLGRASLEGLRLAVARDPDVTPTAEQVAASPYAQIEVVGPEGGAVLLLGNVDDGRQAFYSGDRKIVYLRDGLLSGSYGLAQDAADIRIEGDNPFARLPQLQQPQQVARRYDWMPSYRYGVPVIGQLRRVGSARVTILGVERDLLHFRETLRGPGVDATNEYWADPASGFIWKSRQLLAPGITLEILQLKPYQAEGAG